MILRSRYLYSFLAMLVLAGLAATRVGETSENRIGTMRLALSILAREVRGIATLGVRPMLTTQLRGHEDIWERVEGREVGG